MSPPVLSSKFQAQYFLVCIVKNGKENKTLGVLPNPGQLSQQQDQGQIKESDSSNAAFSNYENVLGFFFLVFI